MVKETSTLNIIVYAWLTVDIWLFLIDYMYEIISYDTQTWAYE